MVRRSGRDWPLRLFAGLVGWHAAVQVACVVSASLAVALTRPRALGALALSLAAAALAAWRVRPADEPQPDTSPRRAPWLAAAWLVAGGAVAWSASLWLRLWRLAFARPSYDWDGLYYHIPAINEWAVAGRVHWIESSPDVPFVNYPMGVEAHAFLMHQALALPGLVDACNLWYWPLAFFAVVVLARRLGAGGPWPWLAGGLLAGAPLFVCQGVTTYIDPGSAACVMALVVASVLLVFGDEPSLGSRTALWGASLGLVLGSKGTGLPMAAVAAALVVGGTAWRGGWRRWPRWLPRLALGVVLALAVGGYWYARAAYRTGNPVHPVQVRFGSLVLLQGYDAGAMMRGNLPAWLARYPAPLRPAISWLQLDAPIEGYAPTGGLGYLWPFAGLPAALWLALAAARNRVRAGPAALFGLALVAALFLVQPAMWWGRFTVWLHVFGLAALAVALHRGWTSRGLAAPTLALLCAAGALGLAAWESERTLAIEQARGRTTGPAETYTPTVDAIFPGLSRVEGFDRFLAARSIARSPWGRSGTLFGGVLALPLGQRHVRFLASDPAPTADQVGRLRDAGVEWILWDAIGAGPVPDTVLRQCAEHVTYARGGDTELHALRLAR